jgi:hypothetical protein
MLAMVGGSGPAVSTRVVSDSEYVALLLTIVLAVAFAYFGVNRAL